MKKNQNWQKLFQIRSLLLGIALFSLTACAGTGGTQGTGGNKAQTAPVTPEKAEGPGDTMETLFNREWRLVEVTIDGNPSGFSRQELEDLGMGDAYTLRFDQEGISGKAAPNRYHGPYQAGESGELSFSTMASTRMASFQEPQGLREQDYFRYLAGVQRWDLIGDQLCLSGQGPEGQDIRLLYGD